MGAHPSARFRGELRGDGFDRVLLRRRARLGLFDLRLALLQAEHVVARIRKLLLRVFV